MIRGSRVVIPYSRDSQGVNPRQRVVYIAQESHLGGGETKRVIRSHVRYPNMDQMIKDNVAGCMACLITVRMNTRDPPKPTPLSWHGTWWEPTITVP